jgi:hypothetical protein
MSAYNITEQLKILIPLPPEMIREITSFCFHSIHSGSQKNIPVNDLIKEGEFEFTQTPINISTSYTSIRVGRFSRNRQDYVITCFVCCQICGNYLDMTGRSSNPDKIKCHCCRRKYFPFEIIA